MTILPRRLVPIALTAVLVLFLLLWILPRDSLKQAPRVLTPHSDSTKTLGFNKTIVVASTKKQNTEWVYSDLPDWNKVVYVVDDHSAPFHTERNVGNEANVYLTYILNNYDYLPEINVFTHYHNQASHNSWAFYNTSDTVKHLSLSNIHRDGYASLSCFNKETCDMQRWDWYNAGRSGPVRDVWSILYPEIPLPEIVNAPRFGQFAASGRQIRARPKSDYQRAHDWLMTTELESAESGRVFEYTWHVMFGQDPFFCKTEADCMCQTFNICDIEAHKTLMYTGKSPID